MTTMTGTATHERGAIPAAVEHLRRELGDAVLTDPERTAPFAPDASRARADGPPAAVVEARKADRITFPRIEVDETLPALWDLADWYRRQFEALVIGVTGDPVTPFQWSESLAEQLGAVLVTRDGARHTACGGGNVCTDRAVSKYIIDLVLPPPGWSCG
jgi:hypothetical protein